MKNGWCLDCKYYGYLIADLCKDCDPVAHDQGVESMTRSDKARYEAMYEAAIAKGGDEDVGAGQED